MMSSELKTDPVPNECNGRMWQAIDYVFKQMEPVHYIVTSMIINASSPPPQGFPYGFLKYVGLAINIRDTAGREVARYWSQSRHFL